MAIDVRVQIGGIKAELTAEHHREWIERRSADGQGVRIQYKVKLENMVTGDAPASPLDSRCENEQGHE